MNRYLTRDELAELVGDKPRSLACMKRWLERNQWPYAVNIAGVRLPRASNTRLACNGTEGAASGERSRTRTGLRGAA